MMKLVEPESTHHILKIKKQVERLRREHTKVKFSSNELSRQSSIMIGSLTDDSYDSDCWFRTAGDFHKHQEEMNRAVERFKKSYEYWKEEGFDCEDDCSLSIVIDDLDFLSVVSNECRKKLSILNKRAYLIKSDLGEVDLPKSLLSAGGQNACGTFGYISNLSDTIRKSVEVLR